MPQPSPRAPYHSVTPRIVVADVDAQVAFLRTVFDATGDVVAGRPVELLIDSLESPLDTPYGDRRALVRDPFGNIFQIAHPIDPLDDH